MNVSELLPFLLVVSLGLNLYFAYLLKKQPKQAPQASADLSAFLADILAGNGLVRVERIAPAEVFLRSPRDYQ